MVHPPALLSAWYKVYVTKQITTQETLLNDMVGLLEIIMNPTQNPMIVQMWLWGLDAIRGDLTARGFLKKPRPDNSESSIYSLEQLHLHGHGIWLETTTEILVYRRPSKNWYVLPKDTKVCFEQFSQTSLAWCNYAHPKPIPHRQALALIQPFILEYEAWLLARHGNLRQQQLASIGTKAVKRARKAWRDFVRQPVFK